MAPKPVANWKMMDGRTNNPMGELKLFYLEGTMIRIFWSPILLHNELIEVEWRIYA